LDFGDIAVALFWHYPEHCTHLFHVNVREVLGGVTS